MGNITRLEYESKENFLSDGIILAARFGSELVRQKALMVVVEADGLGRHNEDGLALRSVKIIAGMS